MRRRSCGDAEQKLGEEGMWKERVMLIVVEEDGRRRVDKSG